MAVKAGEKQRTKGRPFKPGQSGNPRGRPPGRGEPARLREVIAAHVPDIIEAMAQKARDGDAAAARLLLDRSYAPLKATEQPTPISIAGETLTEKGRAVLDAVAAGQLTPAQAAQLLAGIGSLARTTEIDELAARVAALEGDNIGK